MANNTEVIDNDYTGAGDLVKYEIDTLEEETDGSVNVEIDITNRTLSRHPTGVKIFYDDTKDELFITTESGEDSLQGTYQNVSNYQKQTDAPVSSSVVSAIEMLYEESEDLDQSMLE